MIRTTIRVATLFAAVAFASAAAAQTTSFLSPAPLTDEGWMPRPAMKKASRLAMEAAVPAPAPAPAQSAAAAAAPVQALTPAAAAPAAPAQAPTPAAAPAPALLPVVQERAEPSGPALRREVTVTGEIVRIGDLVENAGAVAEVAIFRAPDLGQTGSVPAASVRDAVRPHHIVSLDTRGLAAVQVTRASRAVAPKEIEARLVRALAGQSGLSNVNDLAAAFDNEVRTLHIEPDAELGIARLTFDQRTRRFEAMLDLPTGISRRPVLRVTGTLVETAEAVIPLRAIALGQVIKSSDVMIERRPKTEVIAVEDVLGFAAKRALKPGQVIRAGDVMKQELVVRNDTVTIYYEAPGMVLTIRGKAMDSGSMGDVVNVLNIQSKRTIQATVSGPGRVNVTATTARIASNAPAEPAKAPR
jgi:flagellar basal body P-ring formation protein FlgA